MNFQIPKLISLYEDLIKNVPEFTDYDKFGKETYSDDEGISPLGSVGQWLNELVEAKNQELVKKIACYLNDIFIRRLSFKRNLKDEFCVELFWVLRYPTIYVIKPYLSEEILQLAREYLKATDGYNYKEF